MIAKAEGKPFVEPKSEPEKAAPAEVPAKETPKEPTTPEPDYKKLYEELTAKQQVTPKESPTKEPTAPPAEGDDEAAKALQSVGLNMADFQNEFEASGTLSPESYQALAKAGIDESVVNNYIEGQKARAEVQAQRLFGVAGGEDKFKEAVEWAKTNLTHEEILKFNAEVTTHNAATAETAVRGLMSRFTDNMGEPPAGLLKASEAALNASGDVFKSRSEMIAAMSDPRYHRDPAYRKEVEAKVVRSKLS